MSWGNLDDQAAFNAKVILAGNAAWGALTRMVSWSKAHGTDGFIPAGIGRIIASSEEIQTLLTPSEASPTKSPFLYERPGGFEIHDFLDWNDSTEAVAKVRKVRQRAGRLGGAKRQANAQARAKQLLEQTSGKTLAKGDGVGEGVGEEKNDGDEPAEEAIVPTSGWYPAHVGTAFAVELEQAFADGVGTHATRPILLGLTRRDLLELVNGGAPHDMPRREVVGWLRERAVAFGRAVRDDPHRWSSGMPRGLANWISAGNFRESSTRKLPAATRALPPSPPEEIDPKARAAAADEAKALLDAAFAEPGADE